MSQILLVEDDRNLSESLTGYLSQEGYRVSVAPSLAEARKRLETEPRLIILDWMLPDGQGIDFLRECRFGGRETPVILLTARAELVDKILGLETGANDYVTKPFEPRELAARIRVQLRKGSAPAAASPREGGLRLGGIVLNTVTREVRYGGKDIELTRMEYQLLKLLMENPNRVFSREELLNQVWGYDNYPTTRTVDTHVLQLRQKFGESQFETVRGIGYRFRPAQEATQ